MDSLPYLLGDGASWSTVVEEGEPVDTTGTGAATSLIGATTSGAGVDQPRWSVLARVRTDIDCQGVFHEVRVPELLFKNPSACSQLIKIYMNCLNDSSGSYEHYKSVEVEVEHLEPGFELQGANMVEMGHFRLYFHSYALYLVPGALNLQSFALMILLDDSRIIWSR
ncbi:hypothetical protein Tco_0809535 [Tanacetum coccineum]